jgi:hypothetical protein
LCFLFFVCRPNKWSRDRIRIAAERRVKRSVLKMQQYQRRRHVADSESGENENDHQNIYDENQQRPSTVPNRNSSRSPSPSPRARTSHSEADQRPSSPHKWTERLSLVGPAITQSAANRQRKDSLRQQQEAYNIEAHISTDKDGNRIGIAQLADQHQTGDISSSSNVDHLWTPSISMPPPPVFQFRPRQLSGLKLNDHHNNNNHSTTKSNDNTSSRRISVPSVVSPSNLSSNPLDRLLHVECSPIPISTPTGRKKKKTTIPNYITKVPTTLPNAK